MRPAEPCPQLMVSGLVKVFRRTRVVDNVSFEISKGEIVAVAGPNGAGKSTLLKILAGLLAPESGQVRIDGTPASLGYAEAMRKLGVTLVLQDDSICAEVSVLENLFLGSEPRSRMGLLNFKKMRMLVQSVLIRKYSFDLPDLEVTAGELSGGQQKLIAVGRAILFHPRILLLDEPTASLSIEARHRLFSALTILSENGTTIVFSTHSSDEILSLARRLIALQQGSLLADRQIEGLESSTLLSLMNGE